MKKTKRQLAVGAEGQGADPGSELSATAVGNTCPTCRRPLSTPSSRASTPELATKYTHQAPSRLQSTVQGAVT